MHIYHYILHFNYLFFHFKTKKYYHVYLLIFFVNIFNNNIIKYHINNNYHIIFKIQVFS